MEIDYFLLADAAQVVGNKLYMIGGGWDTIWVSKWPTDHPFTICVGIRVPWERTNKPHQMTISVLTADGQPVGELSGKFEVGKPAGLAKGASQLISLTFPATVHAEQPGRFELRASIDGTVLRTLTFSAVPQQGAAPPS